MSTTMQEMCASVQSVTNMLTRLGDALAIGDSQLMPQNSLCPLRHSLSGD